MGMLGSPIASPSPSPTLNSQPMIQQVSSTHQRASTFLIFPFHFSFLSWMPITRLYLCNSPHIHSVPRSSKHQILIKATSTRRQPILFPVMSSTTKRRNKFYQNLPPFRPAQTRWRRAYPIPASSQVRLARNRSLRNQRWQSYNSPANLNNFSHLRIRVSILCQTVLREAVHRRVPNLTKLRKVVRFYCLRALSHFYSTKCPYWCNRIHHKVFSWFWGLLQPHSSRLRV